MKLLRNVTGGGGRSKLVISTLSGILESWKSETEEQRAGGQEVNTTCHYEGGEGLPTEVIRPIDVNINKSFCHAEHYKSNQNFRHPELVSGSCNSADCNGNKIPDRSNSSSLTFAEFVPSGMTAGLGRRKAAFTLAEVLITLGVIGVVAAVTLPALITNIQDRVRAEQVRTAKYKLTLATDKMKSLGLLQESYPTTQAFVNELQKHFKIAKVCDSSHIKDCWPTDTIQIPVKNGNNAEYQTTNVSDLTNGTQLKSLGLATGNIPTVGIITGDGVPMIMTYSPQCTPLEPSTTFSWSNVDGKPETNATTNCISAIFDINGKTGPNRIGKDVRTLNSLFGSVQFSATSASKSECEALKSKGLIKNCSYSTDYYAGAVKKCNDLGLHLPSFQMLAVAAGTRYGRTDIGAYTLIMKNGYESGGTTYDNCEDYYRTHNYSNRNALADKIICVDGNSIPTGANAPVVLNGYFWSSSEMSATTALIRNIYGNNSSWYENYRYDNYVPLCVGD